MRFNLLGKIKEEAKKARSPIDKFNFITEAAELGLIKADNPCACSGSFVWKDGSKIEFGES
jgi:hypothetical protein